MSPQLSSNRILRMVATHSIKECEMCKDSKVGYRWEYKNYQYIPNHNPEILLLCKKCVYKEVYGTKNARKALRQKLLHKMNYNFKNETPTLEK